MTNVTVNITNHLSLYTCS